MDVSFSELKRVPSHVLQQRLETVKELKNDPLEMYEVAKDKLTGEHYLHYAYLHKQVAAIGPQSTGEEIFHQLLPLDTDDVLGIIVGDEAYIYPEAWDRAFLRNGPEGDYVWFDPAYTEDETQSELIGRRIQETLLRFKQSAELSPQAVQKLMEELDRARRRDNSE
ncbi:hypothetical protein [Paenibacillus xerothermodurans]|uniref:Uncharacterized protein n=1 Tax=Paenibacillus xerothermodurans TaxID=1977292 RepID=A0A2W1NAT3_PAEXE|nr:hypothetical protein [Paenibacillus xerothermodurans]PZE21799.1 hypothetical protein CBW46_005160 [Paenibacillus xerothermodurans]